MTSVANDLTLALHMADAARWIASARWICGAARNPACQHRTRPDAGHRRRPKCRGTAAVGTN